MTMSDDRAPPVAIDSGFRDTAIPVAPEPIAVAPEPVAVDELNAVPPQPAGGGGAPTLAAPSSFDRAGAAAASMARRTGAGAWKLTSRLAASAAEHHAERRPMSPMATVLVAAVVGGIFGALATAAVGGRGSSDVVPIEAVQGTVAVLATEVRALRTAVAASLGPMAAVSPEITGSVRSVASPTDGWTVTKVEGGRALLRGNGAFYEVVEGSTVPGLGTVRRIAKEAGRWVVTTESGFIISAG